MTHLWCVERRRPATAAASAVTWGPGPVPEQMHMPMAGPQRLRHSASLIFKVRLRQRKEVNVNYLLLVGLQVICRFSLYYLNFLSKHFK